MGGQGGELKGEPGDEMEGDRKLLGESPMLDGMAPGG